MISREISAGVSQGFLIFNQLAILGGASFWAIGMYLLFHYFLRYRDSSYLKILVCWLGIMDTIRLGLTIEHVFTGIIWIQEVVAVKVHPNSDRGELVHFGNGFVYLVSALVAIPAEAFFVYRIWRFSGQPVYLPCIVSPLLLFQLVFPIAILTNRLNHSLYLFIATCAVIGFVDVMSCCRLTFILWRKYVTRDSTLKSTTSLLFRLLLLSINTGLWSALVALVLVLEALLFIPSQSVPFLGYYHMLSPIHFLTVLVNLTSRSFIRNASGNVVSHGSFGFMDDLNLEFGRV
ncbi:hypothetical protein CPB83DRAFT_200434 [Crepidotus variabilis]|uniref:DUF6534 domain-containing protein n=1 Tax=Crepidotus variabilis TaxID=179855 RepID=A0A9P6EJI9_9AGAR|nr:hypothetical protein CPB83DRAFT_200434 [Crepidotus variabilis]